MPTISEPNRDWDVLLIGGPSGVGKSTVSYPIARKFDVGITEVDDLYITAEQTTTPEQQPLLHYWRTQPEAASRLTAEEIVGLQIDVSRVLSPAITAVIANHLETGMPVVLDGDYLLPELLAQPINRVRAVFLYEPDERQIVENFVEREPGAGEQTKRAQVSYMFGEWLSAECENYGIPALPARPWRTLSQRVIEASA